jgi:hypothetical protein
MANPVKYTPPATPPSPSASYYDLSDDDENEYNAIAHSRSGRGVKLLYSKSKVGTYQNATMRRNNSQEIGLCPPIALR